jgi:hypothetical protein
MFDGTLEKMRAKSQSYILEHEALPNNTPRRSRSGELKVFNPTGAQKNGWCIMENIAMRRLNDSGELIAWPPRSRVCLMVAAPQLGGKG